MIEAKPRLSRRGLLAGGATVSVALAGATEAAQAAGPLRKSDKGVHDSFFGAAVIDTDEWRDTPFRHRFVHGSFAGTDTRFTFYMPPAELYKGRLFQFLQGGPGGSESTMVVANGGLHNGVRNAFEAGAIMVESNQGHIGNDMSGLKGDFSILLYRASAETARFAKQFAAKAYGKPIHHAYVYGGSGGGVRSLQCLENSDEWDGGVPFILPCGSSESFSALNNMTRLLGAAAMARADDANDVGGSGNPFEGLSPQQSEALATLYRAGFPRGAQLGNSRESILVWCWTPPDFANPTSGDPTYFEDFWTKPGYVGHDQPELNKNLVFTFKTRVVRILNGGELAAYQPTVKVVDDIGFGEPAARLFRAGAPTRPAAVILEGVPNLNRMGGAGLKFLSGAGAGRTVYVIGVHGDALVAEALEAKILDDIKVGDEVEVSNRDFTAYGYYHRHALKVPDAVDARWGTVDGKPIYVQRKKRRLNNLAGEYKYNSTKKAISIQNMWDRGTWPISMHNYRTRWHAVRGGNVEDYYRVQFNEHALHGGGGGSDTRHINYLGHVHQALHDLAKWVEDGVPPPASSNYEATPDAQIVLKGSGRQRGAVQHTVVLKGNGTPARVEVRAGTPVRFEAVAEAPPGGGRFTGAEWDFDGKGQWPVKSSGLNGTRDMAVITAEHTYATPGTYFAVVRVKAHRDGAVNDEVRAIYNLGRIRVVVT